MLFLYTVTCSCGSDISIKVPYECTFLHVHCNKCDKLMGACKPIEQTQPVKPESLPTPQPKSREEQTYGDLSHYELGPMIGEGATSKVYLAQHKVTKDKAAVKILSFPSPELIAIFDREMDLLEKLSHPNIVSIKGKGLYKNKPYFITEYLEGKDLEKVIEKDRLSSSHTISVMMPILDALIHAMKYNIIHRDIKPANIFFLNSRQIKLIDFGIGKVVGQSYEFSESNFGKGSPYYMAPEQCVDAKRVDFTADVYAVGATMYHTLSGVPPFEECSSFEEMFTNKHLARYVPLAMLCPELSPNIINIVSKAMSQDPKDRYANAQQMKSAILAAS